MYCIYLKKRKGKPFCKLLNRELTFAECSANNSVNNCKEYKTKNFKNSFYKKSTIFSKNSAFLEKKTPKSPKKVQKLRQSTNKHRKADRSRFSIITNDLEHCIICGRKREALHEIFYGAYRHISIKYGLIIPLCLDHHTQGKLSIHNDRKLDLYYKRLAENIFISKYSYELYMKEFIIDYLNK